MKKRLASSIMVVIITFGSLIISNLTFCIFTLLCGLLSVRELYDLRFKDKKVSFIRFISTILMLIIITSNVFYKVDVKDLLLFAIVILMVPLIFYNDFNKYNIEDALYITAMIILIGLPFNSLLLIRIANIYQAIYLFILCYITDTFSYIGGSLIGKHRLTSLSPKKTWEGCLVGSLVGSAVGSVFFYTLIGTNTFLASFLLSFILSVMCHFGDLIFSSIKRYYRIKDFSNFIPGHGGILDRFDSTIFTTMVYVIILSTL